MDAQKRAQEVRRRQKTFRNKTKTTEAAPLTLGRHSSAGRNHLLDDMPLPRSEVECQDSSQEAPKSTQKRPKRAPRRYEDHIRIEDVCFQKCRYSSHNIKVFEGRRIILMAQNRPEEGPREDKRRLRNKWSKKRRDEGTKRSRRVFIWESSHLREIEGRLFGHLRLARAFGERHMSKIID